MNKFALTDVFFEENIFVKQLKTFLRQYVTTSVIILRRTCVGHTRR